jgi:hypothetical protein
VSEKPAAAPASDGKRYKPMVRDLAANIYSAASSRMIDTSGGGLKLAADPSALAHACFKLAEAFQSVEDELNSANMPKNAGYKLDANDISSWMK